MPTFSRVLYLLWECIFSVNQTLAHVDTVVFLMQRQKQTSPSVLWHKCEQARTRCFAQSPGEIVRHGIALTAKRIYCLQIKKIILSRFTWMGMSQPPTAFLSHFKMQNMYLPASSSCILRDVQCSSVFCHCKLPIIPLRWVDIIQNIWLQKYYLDWSHFKWLMAFLHLQSMVKYSKHKSNLNQYLCW